MTLLHEMRHAASDSTTSLPDLLRKTKILARRLGNGPLEEWTNKELEGYEPEDQLPPYRVMRTESMGTFQNFGSRRRLRIPTDSLPEQGGWREMATTVPMREPIAHIADMVSTPTADDERLGASWPINAVAWCQQNVEFYSDGLVLQSAWRVITRAGIAGMLDTLRTRILGFALDIEQENPRAGEIPGRHDAPIPQERVAQIVNHTIFAGGNPTVAIGSSGFQQSTRHEVQLGDWDGLRAALAELGVSAEDVVELERALASDSPTDQEGGIGPATRRWIATAASKVGGGAAGWTGGEIAQALEEPIRGFLGLFG